jgi:predicted ATPase
MALLERGPALDMLSAALGEVSDGEGRVALVYGEAGIGKTPPGTRRSWAA